MEKLLSITTVNEIDREKPYTADTFRQAGAKRLAKLQEIKALLESEGYEQRRADFEAEQERLMQKWQSYTAPYRGGIKSFRRTNLCSSI